MVAIQQRRERANRQINERLRTLIAAYKTLGGSFTGDLSVDPTHLRDLRGRALPPEPGAEATPEAAERRRRIRDAAEAALSDIILLGTADQVRLAARAAREMAAGRPVHTADLVASLRDFIRDTLDLDPVPDDAQIPAQGPARPAPSGGGKGRGEGGGGGGGGGGGMMGMGMGAGGAGDHRAPAADDPDPTPAR
nr:hypothetical protein [Rubellimicrobium aerolatum]